jgi:putative DNA primase/helicase
MSLPPNGADAILETITKAVEVKPEDAEIERLAGLNIIDFERALKPAAKALDMRPATLEKLVKKARGGNGKEEGDNHQGRALELPTPEPWHEPVDGAALLEDIAKLIKRHVILGDRECQALALWIIASHVFDIFDIFPRVAVLSPTMRCGKTTLLEVIGELVARPMRTDNISASALFRMIEAARPTLFIDEADTFLAGSDELRGIINSGYRRDGAVIRTVGDDHEPRRFSTFSPLVIAQIGKPAATIYDRSIVIHLKRKAPGEKVARFRGTARDEARALARKVARRARDTRIKLAASEPAVLEPLNDRANDNWLPLLAVADAAGGGWRARARHAAIGMAGDGEGEVSIGELLLADIHSIYVTKGQAHDEGRLSSDQIVGELVKIEGRPWAELNGRPLTQNGLARLLRPFEVGRSQNVRIGEKTPKGYYHKQFVDAFSRYLPKTPLQSATPPQNAICDDLSMACEDSESATSPSDVAVQNPENPSFSADCGDVAVQSADFEEDTI